MMEAAAPEEATATSSGRHVVKGKRTKRQRVQSPIPFALTTNSSSGDAGGYDCCADVKDSTAYNFLSSSSPTTSSNEFQDSTDEEADMANCLILLARGHFKKPSPKREEDHNFLPKFNSRKFLETSSAEGGGKVGYYVYECKTCSRTFPSFQALGGHRASHKKPKAVQSIEAKRAHVMTMALSSDDEDQVHYKHISSLSLQLSNNNNSSIRGMYGNNNNSHPSKTKIHECAVCGAEFASGQALGGHMRRHRGPIGSGFSNSTITATNTATATTNLALATIALEAADQEPDNKNGRNVISLDLDLNLPAPEEHKFIFASKQQEKQPQPQQQEQQQQQQQQQQQEVVFSGPALVDCHY